MRIRHSSVNLRPSASNVVVDITLTQQHSLARLPLTLTAATVAIVSAACWYASVVLLCTTATVRFNPPHHLSRTLTILNSLGLCYLFATQRRVFTAWFRTERDALTPLTLTLDTTIQRSLSRIFDVPTVLSTTIDRLHVIIVSRVMVMRLMATLWLVSLLLSFSISVGRNWSKRLFILFDLVVKQLSVVLHWNFLVVVDV